MDITKETKKKKKKTVFKEPFSYRKLFISTFLISAFTVGGGFVLIPLMKAKFVDEYGWLEENEALDLVSIAQSAPGVMAANSSSIMGYRMGGFLGSLTALLATELALPLVVMAGTFIAAVVFKINIMHIIAVDAIIGLFLMRDPQYD